MVYMQVTASAVYIQMKDLAQRYHISLTTVRSRKKEIEEEVQKGRYPANSLISDEKLVFINELVFLDYLHNRKRLRNASTRKYAKDFHPADWVPMLGFTAIEKMEVDDGDERTDN